MKVFSMTSKLLKNKEEVYQNVQKSYFKSAAVVEFVLVGLGSLVLFGIVMATKSFTANLALDLSWKMIVLIWGPILICLPSLFVFSVVRGSRIKLAQLTYLIIASLAIAGIVLISLTPIVWFFTWTSDNSGIIEAMDIMTIIISLSFGLYFLSNGFTSIYKAHKKVYPECKSAVDVILVWLILLIIVIFQMSQKLEIWFS